VTMSMPLEKWQERLERHFESLSRVRAGSGFPIFALEHNLNNEQLSEISSLLRSRLKARLSLSPHWLLWVIYATERGYSYRPLSGSLAIDTRSCLGLANSGAHMTVWCRPVRGLLILG
jgi:hypothetical protein